MTSSTVDSGETAGSTIKAPPGVYLLVSKASIPEKGEGQHCVDPKAIHLVTVITVTQ